MKDLSKAFDCIDHEQLIVKMHACSVDIKSLKFIDSYCAGRKQSSKVNSSFSENSEIHYGVPQGSTLVPLLFNIHICDIFYQKRFCKLS